MFGPQFFGHAYRTEKSIAALVLCALLCGCAAPLSPPQQRVVEIDQLYLATAKALQQPDRPQGAVLRNLTEQLDALASADAAHDPCVEQKRRQLMPIVISLTVINRLHDPQEQQALRVEALQDLVSLSSTKEAIAEGDLCFGRGFPAIMLGKP